MILNEEQILKRADEIYMTTKYEKRPFPLHWQSLEVFQSENPDCNIKSDQVKALLKALVEEINKQQNQLF